MAKKINFLVVEPADEIYNTLTTNTIDKKVLDNEFEFIGADSVESAIRTALSNDVEIILYNVGSRLISGSAFYSEVYTSMFLNEISGKNFKVILFGRGVSEIDLSAFTGTSIEILNKCKEGSKFFVLDYDNFNFKEDLNDIINKYYKFKKLPLNINSLLGYVGKGYHKHDGFEVDIYKLLTPLANSPVADDQYLEEPVNAPSVYIMVSADGKVFYMVGTLESNDLTEIYNFEYA